MNMFLNLITNNKLLNRYMCILVKTRTNSHFKAVINSLRGSHKVTAVIACYSLLLFHSPIHIDLLAQYRDSLPVAGVNHILKRRPA